MRNTVRGVVLAAAIVLGLSPLGFAPAVAFGQTVWHVDDDACPGPGSGSEVDPFCKIQDALNAAALNGDEIIVSPGTYNELINFIGKAVHLHSSGGVEVTTLDGTGLDGSVVTCITGEGSDTILEGFTITGGTGTWCVIDSDLYCGGGMYMVDASPTVSDCTFINNSANSGGGVYISGMSPSITDCTFTNNSALLAEYWFEEHGGGGVFVFQSSPIISDCTFTQNTSETDGGGIRNIESLTIVRNCSFSNNTADVDGGGIDNYDGQYPYIPITVEDCTFDSNVAGASGGFAEGGGVNSQGSITVSGCTFNDNSASHEGGGLATEFGDVNISSCTFTNNNSIAGGGVFTFQGRVQIESCSFISNTTTWIGGGMADIGSDAIITNCLFQSNKSHQGGGLYQEQTSTVITSCVFNGNISTPGVNRSGDGGAIYIHDYYLTLINCSITGNRAESGGGIYAYSDFAIINSTISNNVALVDGGGVFHLPRGEISTFTNTILFDNSAGGLGSQAYPFRSTFLNFTYNDIQGSSTWDPLMGIDGGGNMDADPLFMRNPDNGGDGWGDDPLTLEVDEGANDDFGDLRLRTGSPCINTGDPNFVAEVDASDLEGHPRVLCSVVDMGAYEFGVGDYDCDQIVSMFDFSMWEACLTDPDDGFLDAACEVFDFNADGDVDLQDFAGFQLFYSGM